VIGKRNKYREVPLNATARKVLEEYLPTLPADTVFLFPSGKTKGALSERALGYIVKKYARVARLPDVSPHDLRHRFGYRMAESVPLHRLAQIIRVSAILKEDASRVRERASPKRSLSLFMDPPRHLAETLIMGHESLDTTKLYIQGTKQDLQQAVETIAWT